MDFILVGIIGLVVGAGAAYAAARVYFTKKFRVKEQELKELLEKMKKLEDIRSIFVANVTHELKTPLTSIKGYIELLKSCSREEEMRNSFYDIIDIETDRLHSLIDDLLQLAEIEHRKDETYLHTIPLHALGEEITGLFRPQAEQSGVELQVLIPEDLTIRGDARRMKMLFCNLVDNAIKYNRKGGKAVLRAWHDKNETVIAVSDTGIGIPKDHIAHIFERFYRVDKGRSRSLGGTGLGLSIVKHVVQQHDGSVHVESKEGKGSMFTVRLPD